jgi:HlyD family secretion protein
MDIFGRLRSGLALIIHNKRRLLVSLSILVVAIVAGALIWHSRAGAKLAFSTAVIKRGDLTATINSTGTIEPVEVIDVGAQVAGLIRSFGVDMNGKRVDYGSVIDEGTVLARIDDSVYAADLALNQAQLEKDKAGLLSAAASLEQAKAKLAVDEANWKRAEALLGRKLMAQADFEAAKAARDTSVANVSMGQAALAQAKASVVIAQALVAKAQRNLAFCTIKSPVRGVIIDRRVNIGQTVVASLNAPSLFLIAKDLTRMQIWVAVNEADVGRIVPGGPVDFTCDAFPGREFKAKVGKVRLNATMTQNVVMYTVEVDTENPGNVLMPYLTANVHFIVGQESNALLAPNAALRWSPSSPGEVLPSARSAKAADPAPGVPGPANGGTGTERTGTLWVKDGAYVRPVSVKLGISDGTETAITADAALEGQEVVTGEVTAAAQSEARSPFMPQVIRR